MSDRELTEFELVKNYKDSGRGRYLAVLYRRYQKDIYIYCRNFFSSQEDAEDAASETFFKMVSKIESWNPKGTFIAWLLTIAKRTSIDMIRHKGSAQFQRSDFSHMHDEVQKSPEQEIIAEEERLIAKEALLSLKPEQRRCFILRYKFSMSREKISVLTDWSPNKVRSCIQNARQNFIKKCSELIEKGPKVTNP